MIGDPKFEATLYRATVLFLAVLGVFWLAFIVALVAVAVTW